MEKTRIQEAYEQYTKDLEKDKETIRRYKREIKFMEKEIAKRQRWLHDAEYSYNFNKEILKKIEKDMKEEN